MSRRLYEARAFDRLHLQKVLSASNTQASFAGSRESFWNNETRREPFRFEKETGARSKTDGFGGEGGSGRR
jgi:hypothetical protein